MYDWTSQDLDYRPDPPRTVRFWPVRLDKFLVLMVCTFGVYMWVWFWRNWSAVDREESRGVNAFARTFFSGIFYFSLVRRVGIPAGALLAIGFIGSSALARLPGDWSYLTFAGYLFLLPTVVAINRMNHGLHWPSSSRWRKRDAVPVVIISPVTLLIVAGILMPGYEILEGSDLDIEQLVALQDAGILLDDESVLYLYPDDALDIAASGVMLSDIGFTSYWIDPVTEELQVEFLPYEIIEGIEVNFAGNWWDDTWIRLITIDGATLHFMLPSNDSDDDKDFVDELRSRMTETQPADANDA